jgi:hypothetical protein
VNCAGLNHDWNKVFAESLRFAGVEENQVFPVLLDSKTLRDGLQSPSVRDPSIAEKLGILHLMEAPGINAADIGLPGPAIAPTSMRLPFVPRTRNDA